MPVLGVTLVVGLRVSLSAVQVRAVVVPGRVVTGVGPLVAQALATWRLRPSHELRLGFRGVVFFAVVVFFADRTPGVVHHLRAVDPCQSDDGFSS